MKKALASVGVRELKNHLSEYLQRVRRGERVVITERGKPIAALHSLAEADEAQQGWALVEHGAASWSGGKPTGSRRAPRLRGARGKTTAEMVIEDRR